MKNGITYMLHRFHNKTNIFRHIRDIQSFVIIYGDDDNISGMDRASTSHVN